MEERLPPEAPYLRAFLRKLAADPTTTSPAPRIDIRPILAALEEPERGIMERTYLCAHSIRQVAQDLRMAEGTVKSHLHRAHQRIDGADVPAVASQVSSAKESPKINRVQNESPG
ncbi:MAG: sigma-70 family RNA polymerase sigma factor [Planctomycetes bacterium]|nr:sigma-70 family RNA polymerase sigma factor [Planctomycetota bacterium]MCP4770783.1 sigma-70 family RNA polymerase sigma factor [Planctomycetota bacterium]MCP4862146.1 sigma-70 family RNA polymerase sigma factor [Planctomycetota bacterium]